jgi:hypothetical protein
MKRIRPGVYDDEQGGLHIEPGELLAAAGYPDTPTNRETLVLEAIRLFAKRHPSVPVTVSDDPLAPPPRPRPVH